MPTRQCTIRAQEWSVSLYCQFKQYIDGDLVPPVTPQDLNVSNALLWCHEIMVTLGVTAPTPGWQDQQNSIVHCSNNGGHIGWSGSDKRDKDGFAQYIIEVANMWVLTAKMHNNQTTSRMRVENTVGLVCAGTRWVQHVGAKGVGLVKWCTVNLKHVVWTEYHTLVLSVLTSHK
jgi:hypothetical protein